MRKFISSTVSKILFDYAILRGPETRHGMLCIYDSSRQINIWYFLPSTFFCTMQIPRKIARGKNCLQIFTSWFFYPTPTPTRPHHFHSQRKKVKNIILKIKICFAISLSCHEGDFYCCKQTKADYSISMSLKCAILSTHFCTLELWFTFIRRISSWVVSLWEVGLGEQ